MIKETLYQYATDQKTGVLAQCVSVLLLVISWTYGGIVRIIALCYAKNIVRSVSLAVPVVSIGNLTLGGTGKTPLTACIADFLYTKGKKPAVLMRGYMAANRSSQKSDEAQMLTALIPNVPVFVGADRYATAKQALQADRPDIFLLDDGFQHWRLKRDLDIVVIDAVNPFGNKHLLPRGILREPLSALARADILLLTKTDLARDALGQITSVLREYNDHALIAEAAYRIVAVRNLCADDSYTDSEVVRGKNVCCVSAIGNPDAFEQSLIAYGAHVVHGCRFIDHHQYTKKDVEAIVAHCQENNIPTVMTTQKDAVKLQPFVGMFSDVAELLSIEITVDITKEKDAFFERILRLCNC